MKKLIVRVLSLLLIISSACGEKPVRDVRKAAEDRLHLGIEYMKLEQNEMALDRLHKAIELEENYADAHNALAVLYERMNQNDKATEHYQKALNIEPQNSDIHNNYGQFLCKQGHGNEADQHFLQAVANTLYKTPEIPYTNAGMCALRNKQERKAETYLQKAIQANPNFSLALYYLASLNYDNQHYSKAQDYLKRFLETSIHTPATLWLGIRIAQALDDKATEAEYKRLLRSPPYQDSEQAKLLKQLEKDE